MTPDSFIKIQGRLDTTLEATRRRANGDAPAFPAVVGRVFGNPTVPTQGGRYISVRPVEVSGAEVEAGLGVLAVQNSRSFLVHVMGASAPVAGEDLICRFVGNRWVAERPGAGIPSDSVSTPGCPCATAPRVLTMTSSKPLSNNGIFQNATLSYGPTPPALLPLGLPLQAHFSTATFPDAASGGPFRYYFQCLQGYYYISRLYEISIYGSPYRDIIRYRWYVGLPGNNCDPYMLTNGVIYQGGDASCVVSVTP